MNAHVHQTGAHLDGIFLVHMLDLCLIVSPQANEAVEQ